MIHLLSCLLLGPIGGALAAIGPVTDLHIVNAFIQPDGFNRSGVLAEGVFPGPLITGNKGDNFQINVLDELTNGTMLLSTSIHWHGLFQKTTNWADGPAFVNQCPIAAGDSFLYNFNVPDQAGTPSSLTGNLDKQPPNIATDCADPWWCMTLKTHMLIFTILMMIQPSSHSLTDVPAPQAGLVPTSDAVLINGLGEFPWLFITRVKLNSRTGRSFNGPADAPLTVINVVQGTRYRFRLVSISCDPNFLFSIDGHTFTVIEADGVNHEPVVVDSIQIFAAQRYSFVLTANQSVDNYWIRANPNNANNGFNGGINSAILRYSGAPIVDPVTILTTVDTLQETSLVPGNATANGVDVDLNLALSFDGARFEINGVSFFPPTVPVLLQILSGSTTAAELLPSGSVYTLPLNSVIQLSFNTAAVANIGGPHPFHLHGHTFDVVRSAGSTNYNYVNPPRRDVVSTGAATDNVTIRFTTDNAGPCEVPSLSHRLAFGSPTSGFAIVFAEDAPDVATANPVPDAWNQLCPIYDALTPGQLGGN
ncbi:laccase 1 [Lentinula aciculospora]|uniref:laccase n=1 Tax=Lentinula aciculospora TaxID=153920 RepID=A0A9W9DKC7_9AGAR|nr:laccase 1 [Lentinula aciculospora]